jgi:enoyl-CoA hydratase/carnithine racemase
MPTILYQPGVTATVTLNRPDQGNVVDDEMIELLASTLEQVARDQDCRVLVVRAAGDKFCVGRDPKSGLPVPNPNAYQRRDWVAKITRVNAALRSVFAVTIAAVNGDAHGFGCGLAAQCDLTVASEAATFGFPEIDHGIPPAIVMAYLPRYVPRKIAAEMIFTARKLSAHEAAQLGLVNTVVTAGTLDQEVARLTNTLLEKDHLALRTSKQFLLDTQDMTIEQAMRYGLNVIPVTLSAKSPPA